MRALRLSIDAPLETSTYEYGKIFETFIINQMRAGLDYQGKQYQLSYLLTKDGAEVDLIVERAGPEKLLSNGIPILPWQEGLKEIGF